MSSSTTPSRLSGLSAGIVAILVLAAILALAGALAHADQPREGGPVTWGISPADADDADGRGAIEHIVEPGETVTEHVLVRNLGEQPLTLDLYTADATLDVGVFDLLSDEEESTAVGVWATPETAQLTLEPRERRIVPVTIAVPGTAEPGDHAGGIVAVLRPDEEADDALLVERRVGTRIYLRVAGPVTPELSVTLGDVRYHHSWLPFAPGSGTATLTVTNSGNIRLAGQAAAKVDGVAGLRLGETDDVVIPELLPRASLDVEVAFDALAPLGPLTVSAEALPLTSGGQELGGSVPPGTAQATVWAVPWSTLALLALLVAGALVWRHRAKAPWRGAKSQAAAKSDVATSTMVPPAGRSIDHDR